ncbi:FAST kinase domain-containing protein 4 isoform X1 [Entelurus aequoreus]|uniref:FAST kinase domain-containing protein 4 isoform X1 n=1 Tax=Entelurus aequoreus TaxID=161455 RepID=UPI002B1D49AF|nr:FAST kinase domain-containing protein 4 isoform X1 [Entelurus aequoreus]XP_061918911.1 FAST kinase domain-containing protein 4 isoform X1 [Entelurus aequoreus]XP_061918912.1 FAST kinase domain-containing protein 4 isoform X1 [Entelurus aequoreus]
MATRFLGRYARLLYRVTTQAPAARQPPSANRMIGLYGTQCCALVSKRSFCKGVMAKDEVFTSAPFRTELDEVLEKATVPEEVLKAWEQLGGDSNQAARTLLVWTKLMRKTKGKFQPTNSSAMDSRLRDMMETITKHIPTVWNNTLVSILRAVWVIGLPNTDPVLKSIQTEVMWRLRRLNPKQLAFLAEWGTVPTWRQDVTIVNAVLKQLELRWTEISDAKTVSMLIAKGEHMSPALMDRLEDTALALAEGFTAEEIRKVCVSLASMGRRSVPLLRALSYHLLQRPSSEFSTQLILDMGFSYGKLSFHQSQVLQRMAAELMPNVSELTSSDVTRFAKSMGFLKWLHVPLFEAFVEHYVEHSEMYSILQLCNLLMTFARLDFQSGKGQQFFGKVHPVLESSLSGLEPFLRTDVAWSLCVLQQARPHYLTPLLQQDHAAKLSEGSPHRAENYRLKLLHLAATLHLEHPESPKTADTSSIMNAVPHTASSSSLSSLQSNLREALHTLVDGRVELYQTGVNTVYGWTIEGEVLIDFDNKPIDFSKMRAPHLLGGGGQQTLPEGSRQIAFLAWEFPNFSFKSKNLLGRFSMMKRHLQLAGFILVDVPYYEWLELKTQRQKLAYLKDKMGKAVAEDMAK